MRNPTSFRAVSLIVPVAMLIGCSDSTTVSTSSPDSVVVSTGRHTDTESSIETTSTERPSVEVADVPSEPPVEWVVLRDAGMDVSQFGPVPDGVRVALTEADAVAIAREGIDPVWKLDRAISVLYSQPRTYPTDGSIAPPEATATTSAPRVIAERAAWIVVLRSDSGLVPHPTMPAVEGVTTSSEPLYHQYVAVVDATSGEFLEGYFLP